MMSNVSSYNKGSEVESYSHLIYVEAKNYYQYIMDGEGFLRNGIRIYSIIVDGLSYPLVVWCRGLNLGA